MNLLARARQVGPGLVGQTATLLGMILTVVVGDTEQLVTLVFCSSVATLLSAAATLAFSHRYPALASDAPLMVRSVAVLTSVYSVTVAAISVAGAGAIWRQLAHDEARTATLLMLSAPLVLLNGLYWIGVGLLVRRGEPGAIFRLRLVYGITSLVAVAGLVWWRTAWSLVLATCIAYMVAIALVVSTYKKSLPLLLRESSGVGARTFAREAWRHKSSAATVLLSQGVGTAGGLLTASLGPLSGAWAGVSRLAGGLGTVSQQLISPMVDMSLGRDIRAGDHLALRRRLWNLLWLSLALGVGGALVAFFVGVSLVRHPNFTAGQWVTLALGCCGYWGFLLVLSPFDRLLTFLGRFRTRLTWDLTRACLVGLSLIVLPPHMALAALGAIVMIGTVVYLMLCVKALGKAMSVAGQVASD